MSDSKLKSPRAAVSIPWWQRREASVPPAPTANSDQDQTKNSSQTQSPSSRASLLKIASELIEEDAVKDLPMKTKINLLESKGLYRNEIARLLGIDLDTNMNNDPSQIKEAEDPQCQYSLPEQGTTTPMQQVTTSPTDQMTATSTEQMTTTTMEEKKIASAKHQSSSASKQDITPVVTYPEFLLYSQRPPPLITAQRVLTSLYTFSGAAILVYGASKTFVDPMVKSLNLARHSLFETASTNIKTLNKKLENIVSVVPVTDVLDNHLHQEPDDSSSDIDPADLFHRSTATKTSLSLSSSEPSSDETFGTETLLSNQYSCLQTLKIELTDLLASNTSALDASNESKKRVDEFQHYLDMLRFGTFTNPDAQYEESGDAISNVRAEIRSIKGTLLGARNFQVSAEAARRG